MSDNDRKTMKRRELLIHILCWGIVLFLPLVFFRPNDTWELRMSHWLRSLGGTLSYMIIFYANYVWLVPKLYFKHQRGLYVVANLILVALVIGLSVGWWQVLGRILPDEMPSHFMPSQPRPHMGPPKWNMLFQSALMAVLVAALALAVSMGQRWQHIEETRREAEKAKSEAELSNLRNQLNPHFLLNTLNNIYALIAFAPEKAQTAVEQLSKLLRHVLYENEQNYVPLYKEVAFMKNYIELMRIRVTSNVKVDTDITIADDDATPIAPLIFISLIENAFKHGISPKEEGGVVRIRINPLRDKGLLYISVCDNGVGIQPEQLAQLKAALAQPGERWEHIGVYNVAARLRLLDKRGRLVIRSHPGRGTAISMYLPLVELLEEDLDDDTPVDRG